MAALDLLKVYGSDSDNSSEEFAGFDSTTGGEEKFPPRTYTDFVSILGNRTPSSHDTSSAAEVVDSEGSFFGEVSGSGSQKRKLSKKEARRMQVAKKRRRLHPVIHDVCGCLKDCGKRISKDERMDANRLYWNLEFKDQANFIREHVQQVEITRRVRQRHIEADLRKRHTYKYHVRSTNGTMENVCRKFYLNTLGYSENCG